MNLDSRLGKLEATRKAKNLEPFVIIFSVAKAVGEIRVSNGNGVTWETTPPRFAILGAGPFGSGERVSCSEGKSEQAFRQRIREAFLRLHGRLPVDWQ